MADHNSKGKGRAVQRLDVEDEESRQRRIQKTLEQINIKSGLQTKESIRSFDFGDRTTHPVMPPQELLSRVQAFLPQLEASNVLLAQMVQANPASVDIEHLDGPGEYIEMNLGLGVFEDRSNVSKNGENSEYDDDMCTSEDSEDSGTSDSSSSSSDSCEIVTSDPIPRPMKGLPRPRVRPEIVMLDDQTPASDTNVNPS